MNHPCLLTRASIKQVLVQVFLPAGFVQSSILGHLESLGLLGRGRCFVEFGAGRGKLSHWIHEALKTPEHLETQEDLQLLLVERCTTRFKAGTPDPIIGGPVTRAGPARLTRSLICSGPGGREASGQQRYI